MKTNAIMVCKRKLGSADAMLPIFLTLKQRYPKIYFWVIFPDKDTLEINRLNHELWAAIESLEPKVVVMGRANKLLTTLVILRLLLAFSLCRNVLIKISDSLPAHKIFVRLLRFSSRLTEVKYFSMNIWPLIGVRNTLAEYDLIFERKGRHVDQNPLKGSYDLFFCSASPENFQRILGYEPDRSRYVQMGYPRHFPAWQEFLSRTAEVDQVVNGPRYCLFIMASFASRPRLDEPSGMELFRDIIEILIRHQSTLRIIFKPHATTDVSLLESVARELGLANYAVEHSHAMVLALGAEFVIGYHYSTTMIDAYFLGRPVIEYCGTDAACMALFQGSQSVSGGCHDFFIHRDKEVLAAVVIGILDSTMSPERSLAFMESSFPKIPESFLRLLDELFG